MFANEPKFAILLSSLMLVWSGCRSTHWDNAIQVSQRAAPSATDADSPRARLAQIEPVASSAEQPGDGAADRPAGSSAAKFATVSLSDMDRETDSGTPVVVGADVDAELNEIMEAFRDADPRVREAARRRLLATRQTQVQRNPLPDLPTRAELDRDPFAEVAQAYAEEAEDAAGGQPGSMLLPASYSEKNAEAADAVKRPSAPQGSPEPEPESVAALQADGDDPAETAAADPAAVQKLAKKAAEPASSQPDQDNLSPDANEQKPLATGAKVAELSEQKLVAELIRRWSQEPEDVDPAARIRHQMRLRTLQMLHGDMEDAVQPVADMSSSEQEFLRHYLLAIWTTLDPQGHPVAQRRWSAALPHFREATSHLAAATGTLEVRSLAFCTEVESFGRIKPFGSNQFAAGKQVILYSEIDNFSAERLSNGYETHFQGSYEIFDSSGARVAQKLLPADQQVCNKYRRDYFIAYRLHLPSQLDDGQYRLELTMEDLKGKKYGQSSIDFEIKDR